MRTQADHDDDLRIGRELERKDAEIERLRRSLQKIADLPLERMPWDGKRPDPNLRARRIAIAALGGDPETADHEMFVSART